MWDRLNYLRQLNLDAYGIPRLPAPDVRGLFWELVPRYWQEERTQGLDLLVDAATEPIARSTEYVSYAPALVDARLTPEEYLPILERMAHAPSGFRKAMGDVIYRRFLRVWRAIAKEAGTDTVYRHLEKVIPGMGTNVSWSTQYPYRRVLHVLVPLAGIDRRIVYTVARHMTPPSVELEIHTYPPSAMRTSSTTGLRMPYSWLGVNTWLETGQTQSVVI